MTFFLNAHFDGCKRCRFQKPLVNKGPERGRQARGLLSVVPLRRAVGVVVPTKGGCRTPTRRRRRGQFSSASAAPSSVRPRSRATGHHSRSFRGRVFRPNRPPPTLPEIASPRGDSRGRFSDDDGRPEQSFPGKLEKKNARAHRMFTTATRDGNTICGRRDQRETRHVRPHVTSQRRDRRDRVTSRVTYLHPPPTARPLANGWRNQSSVSRNTPRKGRQGRGNAILRTARNAHINYRRRGRLAKIEQVVFFVSTTCKLTIIDDENIISGVLIHKKKKKQCLFSDLKYEYNTFQSGRKIKKNCVERENVGNFFSSVPI